MIKPHSPNTKDHEEIWADDKLDRRADAQTLKTFILKRVEELTRHNQPRSFVLNIDAEWGTGKTFFLTRLQKELQQDRYIVVYVNAWESEHAADPLLPVMSEIDRVITERVPKTSTATRVWKNTKKNALVIAGTAVKFGAKKLAQKALGEGVDRILEIATADSTIDDKNTGQEIVKESQIVETAIDQLGKALIDDFKRTQDTIHTFRKNLGLFLSTLQSEQSKLPLFVFIDELDRCRPTHAIALLERVKHLFDVSGMAFVVATDTEQLKHSIRAVYGEGFDSGRYLTRFFDRRYNFPTVEQLDYVADLFDNHRITEGKLAGIANTTVVKAFQRMAEGFRLPLRETMQCFQIMHDISTIWPHKVPLETCYLIPLIITYHQHRPEFLVLARGLMPSKELYSDFFESMSWQVQVNATAPTGQPMSEPRGAYSLLGQMLSLARNTLAKVGEQSDSSPETIWAQNVLTRELSIVHSNQWSPGAEPISLIHSYPDLVRSISRFSS